MPSWRSSFFARSEGLTNFAEDEILFIMKHSVYGLIGKKLGHSRSAEFFAGYFRDNGIDAEYRNFPLEDVGELLPLLEDNVQIKGLNVTIPYKEKVIPLLDRLDGKAAKTGAVNVIKIERGNKGIRLIGYNSDITGFRDTVKPYIPENGGNALILGSGGAAKAAAYSLRNDFGVMPKIVSRKSGTGDLTYDDLSAEIMEGHRIIVNATPLGMHPDTEICPPIPYGFVRKEHICIDWVYNPLETLFLRKCRERGAVIVEGLVILHRQALAAWDIWNS